MASVEKIKELLGNGLTNDVVATAVGVTPAYISQLMSDERFAEEVVSLRTVTLTAATSRDRGYDDIEQALLTKLSDVVNSGMIYKTQELLRAIQVINQAKRRGATSQNPLIQTTDKIVTLNMPTVVINSYKTDGKGEVVEVTTSEGKSQTLATMPAVALMQRLSAKHQGQNKGYEQVRRFLPQSSEPEDT